MIEHLGIVEAVGDGQTTISVATSSCSRCHKESACSIGQAAAGRAASAPAPSHQATPPRGVIAH